MQRALGVLKHDLKVHECARCSGDEPAATRRHSGGKGGCGDHGRLLRGQGQVVRNAVDQETRGQAQGHAHDPDPVLDVCLCHGQIVTAHRFVRHPVNGAVTLGQLLSTCLDTQFSKSHDSVSIRLRHCCGCLY